MRSTKRALSLLLALVLLIGNIPAVVFAAETESAQEISANADVQKAQTMRIALENVNGNWIMTEIEETEFPKNLVLSQPNAMASRAVGDNSYTENEPNDSWDDAGILRNDYTVRGSLSSRDLLDHFTFYLSDKSEVIIVAVAKYSSFMMGIWNSSDECIAADVVGEYTSSGNYSYGLYGTLSAGRYYLGILDGDMSYNSYTFYITITSESEEDECTHSNCSEEVTSPTYTKGGYTTYTCKNCGYSYEDDKVSALGLPNPVVEKEDNVLTWEHDGEADSYRVYRKTSSKGEYKLYKTVTEPSVKVGVKVGKTYYYRVKAICDANSDLNSGYSNVIKITGKCAQPEITVESEAFFGKPYVYWDEIDGAEKYYIYRSTKENSGFERIKTTTKTAYTDTSAKVGTKYYYKVKAIAADSDNNSDYSATKSCTAKLEQPTVTITGSSTSGKPIVKWETVTGAAKYRVYRSTSEDGKYELVYTSTKARSYTDKTAKAGTTYYYKVKAIHSKSSADSAYSDVVSRLCDLAKPEVTIKLKNGDPRLTWDEVDGAAKYYIYRATSKNGEYKKIKGTTATSFTDTTAKAGTKYYYKVKAVHSNTDANSVYSAVKYITAK